MDFATGLQRRSDETETARLMIFASYNAVANEPIPGALGANEEGAFMNISPQERMFSPVEKLPDDVLLERRYKPAFLSTRFKIPRTDLTGSYSKASRL